MCYTLRKMFTWSHGKISTKLSLATVSTIPWLYWSIASNSGSPHLYEELKQRVQTTFVTARVNSGAKSTAELCRLVRISHIELASRQTGKSKKKDEISSFTDISKILSLEYGVYLFYMFICFIKTPYLFSR